MVVGSTEGETILAMNNEKPPFDNLKVRQAIAHALDRKAIIDGARSATARRSARIFPPANPAYVDLTGAIRYDPPRPRQLLKEAGCRTASRLTLKLPPAAYARAGGADHRLSSCAMSASSSRSSTVEWARLAGPGVQPTRTTT